MLIEYLKMKCDFWKFGPRLLKEFHKINIWNVCPNLWEQVLNDQKFLIKDVTGDDSNISCYFWVPTLKF